MSQITTFEFWDAIFWKKRMEVSIEVYMLNFDFVFKWWKVLVVYVEATIRTILQMILAEHWI